jgi:coenzyme F420 hydrogenase subunit beta
MIPMVIEKIVRNDLCVGCGVCAAICPDHLLTMGFNNYGEYNPFSTTPCEKNCGLCLKVCPFADNDETEDSLGRQLYEPIKGISHRPETGFYLKAYVGHSEQFRTLGSSGGMATWVMEKLLAEKVVDYIVSVVPCNDSNRLFSYRISDNLRDLHPGTGSVYYPVEMSEVIADILKIPGRYAVIGLPCFIKALRLVQKRNVKLKERICITLSLTCGQLKNAQYTKFLSLLSGIGKEVINVHYRGKDIDKPANNFFFSCRNIQGEEGKRLFWQDGIDDIFINRWFTLNSCNYCDDIFAECADITFMDAWLPPYIEDGNGTSFVLIRSSEIADLFIDGINCHEVVLNDIPIIKIIQSQSGVIRSKREDLAYRLFVAQKKMQVSPQKRLQPKKLSHIVPRWKIETKLRIQNKSKLIFGSIANQYPDKILIQKRMRYDMILIKILTYVDYVAIINFLRKRIRYLFNH